MEGEVGYFRRNHWVPVPSAVNLDELNGLLLAGCRADEQRLIDGREGCVGAALAIERDHLLPVADAGLDLAEVSFPLVNASGCITMIGGVRQKIHFFCLDLPHSDAGFVKAYPAERIEAFLDGQRLREITARGK